ncbi:uncharacterized protein LOC131854526 [Achroia grisella]|uniref:uncharacterized protein LOC131854526 n=1 Tax=Achroia grisella TaxID=688607 RepID=UPI0027D26442|nr:uncharacterized protein LOC131854526 [Achroia grisella]
MLASALKNMAAASANSNSNAKLLSRLSTPKDLPYYSGDPMEWLQFKQAYEESTEVCNFNPKENLWRLRKCLRGAAKEAVSALLISAVTPDKLMATLELRFGNPDIIISRLIQELKKLHPVSQEYQKDIVYFAVKVQNFVEATRAVGRQEYLQGIDAFTLLLSKMPTVLVSKWSDYSYTLLLERKKSRLELLSEFLTQEAVKISTTSNLCLINARSDKYKNYDNNISSRSHSVLVLNDKCQYCRVSRNDLTKCTQFKKALRKDRWRYIKRNNLCYKCLLSSHQRETCPAPACDKDGCGGAHHRLLHYPVPTGCRTSNVTAEQVNECPPVSETVTHINVNNQQVLLKVVPVKIRGPYGVINTTALLDDGSTVSLITTDLANRAGLSGPSDTLRTCGAWNNSVNLCNTTVVTFDIFSVNSYDNNDVYTVKARTINNLDLPIQDLSTVNYNLYKNLRKIKNELCVKKLKPEILLGQDNYHLLIPLQTSLGNKNEPVATRTPLGWCIHGCLGIPEHKQSSHSTLLISELHSLPVDESERMLRDIHDEVRRSFTIESMGVSGKPRENADDIRALTVMEQTATLINGRWEVGLPWKDESCRMPNSFPNAVRRLKGIEKKIMLNTEYGNRYVECVNHLLQNDYARELEDCSVSPRTWYLPHFGVDNPNKKKLRLVFDAAAGTNGLSLNDYLLKGPDLLTSLFGIMVRFRENRVAVTGDIKDMFLRIKNMKNRT